MTIADEDEDDQRNAGKGGVQHGDRHAGEGKVGGNRQVDRLRQDDRHLRQRQDDQDRGVVEDVGEIGRASAKPAARVEKPAIMTRMMMKQQRFAFFQETGHWFILKHCRWQRAPAFPASAHRGRTGRPTGLPS